MSVQSVDLLQGTLEFLVLKTLSWGPMHGFAIARWIRKTTDDALEIEEGALYPALHRMERRAWIESDWGVTENNRRAKYYQITRLGKDQLRARGIELDPLRECGLQDHGRISRVR